MNIFGTQESDQQEKKVYFTEMIGNEVVEYIGNNVQIVGEEKEKELVIPLKKPSWIQAAKERIEKEKKEKEANLANPGVERVKETSKN